MSGTRLLPVCVLVLMLAILQAPDLPPAEAAFPGANGKIAFYDAGMIKTMNPQGADIQTLTAGQGPSWSPDGTKLAFTRGHDIFVRQANGTETPVASGTSVDTDPAWSPDGTKIAYSSNRGGSYQIWVVNSDGTGVPAQITSTLFFALQPDWSPDGTKIAFRGDEVLGTALRTHDIYVVPSTGGTATNLTNTILETSADSDEQNPEWSPDGTQIAFDAGSDPGFGEVYVMAANGSGRHAITSHQFRDSNPSWSPDGTRIALERVPSLTGQLQIAIIDATGGNELVTGVPGEAPDWQTIPAIVQVEFTQGIQELQSVSGLQGSLGLSDAVTPQAFPGENGKIAFVFGTGIDTINPDGTDRRTIATSGRQPSFSPNGRKIAYVSQNTKLVVANADGSNPQEIMLNQGVNNPSWAPDGESLIFHSSAFDLFTVDFGPAGLANLTNITNSPTINEVRPEWSADGTRIAYFENTSVRTLVILEKQTGVLTPVAGTDFLTDFSWSPDNTKFAFVRNTGEHPSSIQPQGEVQPQGGDTDVFVVSASGGTPTNLTNSNTASESGPSWSPDGTRIAYYFQQDVDGTVNIMPASGGVGSPVAVGFEPDWGADASVVGGVEFTQANQQLQSVSALLNDLQGDGKPPVPIVADKAAVMRVYFGDVDQTTEYHVEITGEISDTLNVIVNPGCTAVDRRRAESGCDSLDYYFTPPQGNWNVRLEITETASLDVVVDETFNLASVDTSGLIVKYIPICVRLTPGAGYTCPGNFTSTTAPDLVEKLYPAADDEFFYDALAVPSLNYNAPITNDDRVIADLRTRYNLMSQGGFVADQLAGWLAPNTTATGTLGYADPVWAGSTGRVSWQMDTSAADPIDPQHTLAHEIGHNLGLLHTNLPDGCGAQDDTTDWPYGDSTIQEVGFDVAAQKVMLPTKKDLMTYCTPPGTDIWISPFTYNKLLEGDFNPQRLAPAGADPMEFLVVKGSAQADGSAASIESAYAITSTTPAELSNPFGNYCLHTSGGGQIDYCFFLRFTDHRSGEPLESEAFSVRIPLPPATTRVSLAMGFQELDALEVSALPPSLDITGPDELNGEETISWSASDGDGDPLQYALMYSPDAGETWLPLVADTTETEFTFDTSVLEGNEVLLRVLASDGLNTTIDTSAPITLVTGTPRTWGDVNCDGALNIGDAIALARNTIGLPVSQQPGCPTIGDNVNAAGAVVAWGNLDCSAGAPNIGDAIVLARHLIGLTPNIAGCPTLGTVVNVKEA